MKAFARAAIFDLDGTLLDTLQDLADSMNAVLEQNGFAPHPAESYRLFVGEGVEQLAVKSLGARPADTNVIGKIVSDMRSRYSENWHRKTRPYPGIMEMLNILTEREIPIAVLSNKPDHFTGLMVRHFFPDTPFRLVLGAREGLPKKPDPSGALVFARDCGLSPHEIAFIGDSGIDMLTAAAADMRAVGILWGFRTRGELLDNGAEVLIADPSGLPDLFPARDPVR